jgi:hypothetical protein
MTIHEIANLFDHLREGFGAGLSARARDNLLEAGTAFRELPDQPLKNLVKQLLEKPAKTPKSKPEKADLATITERIHAVRNGEATRQDIEPMLRSLKGPELKELLKAFALKQTGRVDELRERLLNEACVLSTQAEMSENNQPELPQLTPEELHLVELGYNLYQRLRNTRGLSILEVRAEFEELRDYPKNVLESITKRAGFTPHGSRNEMFERLLHVIEGIKMDQMKEELILTGK